MDIDITNQQQPANEGEYNTPYEIDIKSFADQRSLERYITSTFEPSENIQKILLGFETAEFIEEQLGPKFNLSLQQKREVTRIIRDLLLAKVYLGDIVKTITEKLGFAPESAKQVANEIIRLFSPALEDIKKMHVEKFGKKENVSNPNNTVDLKNK